ncbi:MAG: alkaline phosphatase D family protein [Ignavibacteriaceae bacterium]|jgi:alkaline phosphatase D
MKLVKLISIFLLCGFFAVHAQKISNPPIVGGVTSSAASFVVRIDTEVEVKIGLDVSSSFLNPVFTNSISAKSDSDFFCKLSVASLQPKTKYFYKVFINNVVAADSVERYFTTFPVNGEKSRFKFAFGSCQKQGQPGTIFNKIEDENPVFFLQQGDWGYPDTTESPFSLDDDLVKESFHSRYSFSHPSWQLIRKTPYAYTYDDHDMAGNNVDGSLLYLQAARNMLNGYNKMFPHYPLANIQKGMWQKFSYGNADVFMTDNRSQREMNLLGFKTTGDSIYFSPDSTHSILGDEQMDWLIDELKNSTADWKFISSGTPFNPGMRSAIELAVLLQKDPKYQEIPTLYGMFNIKDIAFELSDKWAGFPKDIYRLLKVIDENKITNVIFLSGDTHTSGVDNGKNSMIPEMMAGPLDIKNMGFVSLMERFGVFVFNSGGHTSNLPESEFGNAYGRVTVFNADSVLLEAVSENGNVLGKTTVKNGYLPQTIAATVAPSIINFDSVVVGTSKLSVFILLNTGTDDLMINHIESSNPNFLVPIIPDSSIRIKPGDKEIFLVYYVPHLVPNQGTYDDCYISIASNVSGGLSPVYCKAIPFTPNSVDEKNNISSFALLQNYPNPFNPSTVISYQLAVNSKVSLKIYDILGNEMATLVNEEQPVGYYSVKFDAANNHQLTTNTLSSGVYFYQLRAGNFVETKKFILMK